MTTVIHNDADRNQETHGDTANENESAPESGPKMVGGIDISGVAEIDAWLNRCDAVKGQGDKPDKVKSNASNAATILRWHHDWQRVLQLDVRKQEIVMVRRPPFTDDYMPGETDFPRPIKDTDALRCEIWAKREPLIKVTIAAKHWHEAMAVVGESYPYDHFKDWLEAREWDGVARCDTWLHDFAGEKDDPYVRAVASKFLISIVARTFRPGEKVDSVLTLQGKQGTGKSTVLRALVGDEWFSDAKLDMGSKDAALALQGPALLELGELEALGRHQIELIKAFVTRQSDKIRPPYGRKTQDFPRRCVFAATTNDDTYLSDVTGNRRFWPVTTGDAIDIAGVAAARDQLFAEAVHRFRSGELWHFNDPALIELAEQEQSDRRKADAWEGPIEYRLENAIRAGALRKTVDGEWFVSMDEVLGFVCVEPQHQGSAKQSQASRCMTALGWTQGRKQVDDQKRRGFWQPLKDPF